MKNIFQKAAIAAALALPVLASAATGGADILFDMDGAGGNAAYTVDLLDWTVGNALAVAGNPTGGLVVGTTTQLLYQANLGSVSLNGGPIVAAAGLGGAQFFTATAGFLETVTSNPTGLSATFGFADAPVLSATNFFYIYANQFGSNLTGVGFAQTGGGTLVMSGYITSLDGSNFAVTTDAAGNPVIGVLDNFDNNDYPLINSIVGTGSTSINLRIQTVDASYFPTLNIGDDLDFAFFNTSQILPFNEADPSRCFSSNGVLGGAACDYVHNLGAVNGVPDSVVRDLQFQTDGNMSFAQNVPEPGSLALVGLALGLVGFVGRRNNKKA